jgi:hypothetical protein
MENDLSEIMMIHNNNRKVEETLRIEMENDYKSFIHYHHQIIILILYIETIICFLLNTITVAFIIRLKLFTPINILIINLSLADCFYSMSIPFFTLYGFMNHNYSSLSLLTFCRLTYFIDITSMMVSISFIIF